MQGKDYLACHLAKEQSNFNFCLQSNSKSVNSFQGPGIGSQVASGTYLCSRVHTDFEKFLTHFSSCSVFPMVNSLRAGRLILPFFGSNAERGDAPQWSP